MKFVDIIIKKRDGQELTYEEMEYFVKAIVNSEVKECQIGAFLMATYLNGLSPTETFYLTKSMTLSGRIFKWPEEWKNLVVDKHSTGGVGDKISLILTPALAACGLKVPMISGRCLGHTGGTLDKLKSIPGFKINLSREDIFKAVDTVGCCLTGQTEDISPADRILYYLRHITGTVSSYPLIAASILSKKAAEGLFALVLDVKVGRASLMKSTCESKNLAELMVNIGQMLDLKIDVLLTTMDTPIGSMIGNSLEVIESLQMLKGKNVSEDLRELVSSLGSLLLLQTGFVTTCKDGKEMIMHSILNGLALEKFKQMIMYQGVQKHIAEKLCDVNNEDYSDIHRATTVTAIVHKGEAGYIHNIDALDIAQVLARLQTHSKFNYSIGAELIKHVGTKINKGESWIKVHHCEPDIEEELINILDKAIHVNSEEFRSSMDRIIT